MAQPDLQEFKPYILNHLKRNRSINDIVLHVCEQSGASWQSVHEYVIAISEENSNDIVLGQSPVLVGLALATYLAGTGMILVVTYGLYGVYENNPQDVPYFLKKELRHNIRFTIAGVLMIVGSLKGMQKVWESIFNKFGIFK
jgi:hypothetical protein